MIRPELVEITRRQRRDRARATPTCIGLRRRSLMLFAVWCLGPLGCAKAASDFPLAAGEYAIRSNMVMPHLEEMRRITARETRCIRQDDPLTLFPVMRQPALRGCAFGYGEARGTSFQYVLVCQSARVATGTIELTQQGAEVVGHLVVKMGGKNMTFTQHVAAVREGECAHAR